MSPYQQLCMKSFVDHGHEYILYAYDPLDVPSGVQLRDASQIVPRDSLFWYGPKAGIGRGSVAVFANMFRYRLLHAFGDWWIDADVVCMSDKLPEADIFLGWEDETRIGNAILKFPPQHPLIGQASGAAEDRGADVEWGETGPSLITALTKQHDLTRYAAPPPLCYALPSADALQLLIPSFRDEVRQKTRNTPLLHTWNEILRRAVVFKWMAPPAGSFMAELFAKHGVSFTGERAYSPDELQRLSDNFTAFTHWSWHQPRIDGQQARLSQITRELELLKALYANAVAELGLRRVEQSTRDEAEFADADVSGLPASGPSVIEYGPHTAFIGEPFNPQPNGQSAIWVRTSQAPPAEAFLTFDGVRLETVISDALLTAAVPGVLLMRPRTVAITLRSGEGQLLAPPVKLVIRGM